jgi:putative hemolysin
LETASIDPEPSTALLQIFLLALNQPIDHSFFILLGVMLLLIMSSGVISGSEVSFFSINTKMLAKLDKSKNLFDQSIVRLVRKPKKLLATILIANNLINISIIILFTITLNKYVDFEGIIWLAFLIEIVVVTLILVIFGELVPKIYANQNSLNFAKKMALPMSFLIRFFSPLSFAMVKGTNIIEKRITKKNLNVSAEELKEAIEITSKQDQSPEDKNILKRIINFRNVFVNQIMTSRMDVTSFEKTTSFSDIISEVNEKQFSRVPVYEESPDNIIGILYIKDLLQHLGKDKNFEWQRLIRKAYFVPEFKKIDDLLKEFQTKKVHMAIVVDEYGGFSGIVTLEDVLEEIVGEITDEFDEAEEKLFKKLDPKNYIFKAKIPLTDFNKVLNLPDDTFEEFTMEVETLGGLMIELMGKIPLKGERTSFKDLSFEIEASDRKRVKEVRLSLP